MLFVVSCVRLLCLGTVVRTVALQLVATSSYVCTLSVVVDSSSSVVK